MNKGLLNREMVSVINEELQSLGMTKGRLQWNTNRLEKKIEKHTSREESWDEKIVRLVNSVTKEDIIKTTETVEQEIVELASLDLIYGETYKHTGYRNTERIELLW